MTTITRLSLDPTGLLVQNRIQNELHTNIDSFARIIIPIYGNFYLESLSVSNNNGVLIYEIDYTCIEFNQEQSLKYGKDIYSAILLFTTDTNATITYQALGGDLSVNKSQILTAYESLDTSASHIAWEEVQNKPEGLKPSKHLHDIDEIYGFEFIHKTLVRIHKAIETTQMPAYGSLLNYIDHILDRYKVISDEYLENNMPDYITKFLQGLNKVYFDIDKLLDLTAASELDGENAGKKSYKDVDIVKEKYMTIEALVGLKKSLFKTYIEKKFTGLGLKDALYTSPERFSIQQLSNGTTVNLISQEKARFERVKLDDELYPTDVSDDQEVTIHKLTNNERNNGGVFLGFNKAREDFHLGSLVSANPSDTIRWKRALTSDESIGLLDVLARHVKDYGNPHEVNQGHIGLDLVENLPVVDKEDIMALKSVHKYLTFDALIYFMRAFLLQNGKSFAPTEKSKNQFIIDNCVVVFTPAGITCKTTCDVAPSPPRSITLSKISQACMQGDSYTPPEAENSEGGYGEPMMLVDNYLSGTYNVGTSTNLVQAIKHFSQCCGYEEPTANFILNMSNEVGASSETDISGIPDGSYFTIELTYPFATNNKLRVSGIYPDSFFSFKSGEDLGQILFEVKNKYFLTKTATYTHEVDYNEGQDNTNTVSNLFVFIDRKYIYENATANAEICFDKGPGVTQLNFNIVWRLRSNNLIVTPAGFPTTLTAENASQRFIKQQFTIPYTEQFNDDSLFAELQYTTSIGSEVVGSNYLTFYGLRTAKTTKTVPMYENGIKTADLTISRENSTGRIIIENITLPTVQNTSDVYFLRNGVSGDSNVVGVVDVWSDIGVVDEWEFPLPMIPYNGNGSPPPPPSSSNTPPPTTSIQTLPPTTSTTAPTTSTSAPPSSTAPTTTPTASPTPSSTISTPPPTTTSMAPPPTNATNMTSVTLTGANVQIFNSGNLRVTVSGVNVGSVYNVDLFTDMSSGVSMTSYESRNITATQNPLEVDFELNNLDYTGHPLYGTSLKIVNNFGRTINFQARVVENNRNTNFRQSAITPIVYENVINNRTFDITISGVVYNFSITWGNNAVVFRRTDGGNINSIPGVYIFPSFGNVRLRATIGSLSYNLPALGYYNGDNLTMYALFNSTDAININPKLTPSDFPNITAFVVQ